MNDTLANLYAELGYEKLIQLQYEMHCFALRMPENVTIICMTLQKLFS